MTTLSKEDAMLHLRSKSRSIRNCIINMICCFNNEEYLGMKHNIDLLIDILEEASSIEVKDIKRLSANEYLDSLFKDLGKTTYQMDQAIHDFFYREEEPIMKVPTFLKPKIRFMFQRIAVQVSLAFADRKLEYNDIVDLVIRLVHRMSPNVHTDPFDSRFNIA